MPRFSPARSPSGAEENWWVEIVLHVRALFQLLAQSRQVLLHAVGILLLDDFEQVLQLRADVGHLGGRAGVEEDFLQQVVVLVQQAAGNGHVLLEGGARRVLVLHHGGEDESRDEGNGQGVGHRLVVLVERVFEDVQLQRLVEVLEEDAAQVVAFGDDDGVLRAQVVEAGEGGAEHGVRGHVAEAAFLVEGLQAGLHGGDVAQDAVLGKHGQHLAEGVEGIFHRGGVDDQLGFKFLYLVQRGEAVGVVDEAQLVRVDVEHGRLVLETQYVIEEGAHLSGSEDQDSHDKMKN